MKKAALITRGHSGPLALSTDVLRYPVSPGAKTVKEIADSGEIETLLRDALLQP